MILKKTYDLLEIEELFDGSACKMVKRKKSYINVEPYVNSKEPCRHSKEHYIHSNKCDIHFKGPFDASVGKINQIKNSKSFTYTQKSPT